MPRKPFVLSSFRDFRSAGKVAYFWKPGAGDLVSPENQPYVGAKRWPAKVSFGFPDTYDAETDTMIPTKLFVVSRPKRKKKKTFFGLFRRGN